MNCSDIHWKLADYLSGDLDEKSASEVLSHLRSCRECARELEALSSEDKIYQAYAEELDRSLDVSPQLWQRVRTAIVAPESKGWWQSASSRIMDFFGGILPRSLVLRQAVFASVIVVLSVGATLLAVHYFRGQGGGWGLADQPKVGIPEKPRRGASQYSLEAAIISIQRAERDYIDAIGMLSRIVDKRKPSLDPQLVAEVERNIRAIDESIAATRAAYHAHPSDPELAHYMLTAYEKKVELLLELAS